VKIYFTYSPYAVEGSPTSPDVGIPTTGPHAELRTIL
jgi:hypothetical protein